MRPNNFLSGQRCPKCFGNFLYTLKTFKEKVFELVKDEYEVLGEYINNKTKIKIMHNICGYIHNFIPADFIHNNTRCPKCAGVLPYTTESFKEKIYELVGDEYELIGEYKNSATKIILKHNICGYEWETSPVSFIHCDSRCAICFESKGERKIRYWLENNNVKFKSQFIFDDLLSDKNYPLKFDFGIFIDELKTKIKYLIEYDGIGHYKPSFGEISYKRTIKHDIIKNIYCRENNISLLRIPYWKFDNIEEILNINILK
jgi:hypothetical protein